jgi:hypothetical protein
VEKCPGLKGRKKWPSLDTLTDSNGAKDVGQ